MDEARPETLDAAPRKAHGGSGRATFLLLVTALALGVLALLAWVGMSSRPRASQVAGADARLGLSADGLPRAEGDAELARLPEGSASQEVEDFLAETLEGRHPRSGIEKSFRGTGSMVVVIDTPPGVEFPAYWQLLIEPSRILQGRESATRRLLEFARGQFEIEERNGRETVELRIDDLPLGGYSVSVKAEDMDCRPHDVVLFKVSGRPDAPGRQHVRLNLSLKPAGFLDGSVRNADGSLAADCPLTLTPLFGGPALHTRTGPDGVFIFPSVLTGRYELSVGDPMRPLIEPRRIVHEGGALHVEEIQLPALASIVLIIVGPHNERVGDATIRGSSTAGDPIDTLSDGAGEALLRYLRPGRLRLRVEHPDGKRGKATITLDGSETLKRFEIRVR